MPDETKIEEGMIVKPKIGEIWSITKKDLGMVSKEGLLLTNYIGDPYCFEEHTSIIIKNEGYKHILNYVYPDNIFTKKKVIGYHKDFCIPKDSIMKMIGEINKEMEKTSYRENEVRNILNGQIQILEKLLGATSQGSPEPMVKG
jgi:hypothetical protein